MLKDGSENLEFADIVREDGVKASDNIIDKSSGSYYFPYIIKGGQVVILMLLIKACKNRRGASGDWNSKDVSMGSIKKVTDFKNRESIQTSIFRMKRLGYIKDLVSSGSMGRLKYSATFTELQYRWALKNYDMVLNALLLKNPSRIHVFNELAEQVKFNKNLKNGNPAPTIKLKVKSDLPNKSDDITVTIPVENIVEQPIEQPIEELVEEPVEQDKNNVVIHYDGSKKNGSGFMIPLGLIVAGILLGYLASFMSITFKIQ